MRLAPCQLGSSFLRFLRTLISFKMLQLRSVVHRLAVSRSSFMLGLCIARLSDPCSQPQDRMASASLSIQLHGIQLNHAQSTSCRGAPQALCVWETRHGLLMTRKRAAGAPGVSMRTHRAFSPTHPRSQHVSMLSKPCKALNGYDSTARHLTPNKCQGSNRA